MPPSNIINMNTQPNTTQHNTPERNNHTDPELQHTEVDKIVNVQFAEEQPKVADDARLGTSLNVLPPSQEIQMPDASWFAAKQLAKPVVLARKDWTSDSAANADIYTVGFPAALQTIDTIHQETLRMYAFYKFNFTFRIQLNGTKFHSGQLLCSWDPFSMFNNTTDFRPFNVYSATGNPHVLLNASTNEPVEITIPYFHPKNFLATNNADDNNDLGTFRITVLNPLRYAEGSSPKLHLTVWFYAHT
uniref:Structural polyprotein 1 n=1 Tax=Picornavirales sp. TaxID=1955153 RepID=A0A646R2B4_9VIRU|nr:structural polyprotein 1 [Picornavirales sp.]